MPRFEVRLQGFHDGNTAEDIAKILNPRGRGEGYPGSKSFAIAKCFIAIPGHSPNHYCEGFELRGSIDGGRDPITHDQLVGEVMLGTVLSRLQFVAPLVEVSFFEGGDSSLVEAEYKKRLRID